jgi:hypothetical protein
MSALMNTSALNSSGMHVNSSNISSNTSSGNGLNTSNTTGPSHTPSRSHKATALPSAGSATKLKPPVVRKLPTNASTSAQDTMPTIKEQQQHEVHSIVCLPRVPREALALLKTIRATRHSFRPPVQTCRPFAEDAKLASRGSTFRRRCVRKLLRRGSLRALGAVM